MIVTADDFGAAGEVNAAVETAFRDGILTTASLMVAGRAADDAIKLAKSLPGLAVGLHLVVVRGKAVLPANDIPQLVGPDGEFDRNLVRAGFRYFFSLAARRQLRAEIRAQFETFAQSGLVLDHVNAHNHMHLHPTVFSLMIEVGREFGLKGVRLPFERSFGLSGLFLSPWVALMRRRLRSAKLDFNDQLIGVSATGQMSKEHIAAALSNLPDGVSELMTHPATGAWEGQEAEAVDYNYAEELAALIDPSVRTAVNQSGAACISFAGIR